MKKLKLILLLQVFVFGALTVNADEDCCPDGSPFSVDCDGDEVDDACSTDDCPDPTITGSEYVQRDESISLSASGTKSPYTWSVSSGSSYISLSDNGDGTADVEGTSEGAATVEVTDGHGNTNTHDVTCFSVEIDLSSSSVDDGEENIAIEIVVEPSSIESDISNIVLEGKKPDGSTTFDNPDGEGISITVLNGGVLDWEIEKARWYEDSSLDCRDDPSYLNSEYDIEGTYNLGGTTYDLNPKVLAVHVVGSLNIADLNRWYKVGEGASLQSMVSVSDPKTQNGVTYYTASVDPSPFNRDMDASVSLFGLPTSQFRVLIEAEENHHVEQFENSIDGIIDPQIHFSESEVRASLQNFSTDDTSEFMARFQAEVVVESVVNTEYSSSVNEVISYSNSNSLRCALEGAAKNSVGVSYHLRLECSYLSCP